MWTLKVVKGAELADKLAIEVKLPEPLSRFTVGRDPGNGWAIADRTLAISARHCEIVGTAAGPALRDLSTNGTFVNGAASRLAGEHLLRDGDRIELGPFDILVSGPPMADRPVVVQASASAALPASAPAGRSAGVMDTAPQRGGDPAAMLAMGGGYEKVGLTEILRAAPPSDDSGLDMTRIRVAPPVLRPASTARAGAVAAPASVTPPSVAPAKPGAGLEEALARGLGVPVQALQGRDLLRLVEELAAVARLGQTALRGLPDPADKPPPR